VLELLDAPGARALVGAADDEGRTLLHWASDRGHAEVCRRLIWLGASPDVRDAEGLTSAHMAALCEHEEALAALLAAGADISIQDADGSTVLDCVGGRFRKKLDAALAEEELRRVAHLAEHSRPAKPGGAQPVAAGLGVSAALHPDERTLGGRSSGEQGERPSGASGERRERGARAFRARSLCALAVAVLSTLAIGAARHLGLQLSSGSWSLPQMLRNAPRAPSADLRVHDLPEFDLPDSDASGPDASGSDLSAASGERVDAAGSGVGAAEDGDEAGDDRGMG